MTTTILNPETAGNSRTATPTAQTGCCIVGGGPAGVMLALLLARKGVDVTLLEAHKDFERDFRGDTVHPAILEAIDQIGLSERLHALRHTKIYHGPMLRSETSTFSPIDFRRLRTRFPYVMLVPQARFLDLLAQEASHYPNFRLVMGARVEQLIEEGGAIRGVRYLQEDRMHELRAALTVAADGRFSKVRRLARIEPVKTSPPMDILWFRLPHYAYEPALEAVGGGFGKGKMLAIFDRQDYWQIGYVFQKGAFAQIKAAGLEALQRSIAEIEPRFTDHVKTLTDWRQFSLLSVESSCCEQWHKPGLLLIGDAAHVMSPIGGVGINYAVQDAIVAANLLAAPLRRGDVRTPDLRKVQRARQFPTKVVQFVQSQLQKRVIAGVLKADKPLRVPAFLPWLFKLPGVRALPARIMAFGVRRVRVK